MYYLKAGTDVAGLLSIEFNHCFLIRPSTSLNNTTSTGHVCGRGCEASTAVRISETLNHDILSRVVASAALSKPKTT